jgi:hypothetical protein
MMTQLLAPAPAAVRDLPTVPIDPSERGVDPKVHPRHLLREALIYVRQSHPNQVSTDWRSAPSGWAGRASRPG